MLLSSHLSARGSVGERRQLPRLPLISPSSLPLRCFSSSPASTCLWSTRSILSSVDPTTSTSTSPVAPHPTGWNQLMEMETKSKQPIRDCVAEEWMKLEMHLVSRAHTSDRMDWAGLTLLPDVRFNLMLHQNRSMK